MARISTIFAAIALVIVVLIATAVAINLIFPKLQSIVTPGSTTTINGGGSSSSGQGASSVSSSASSIPNGNYTAKVLSVKVTQIGFNSSTNSQMFSSNITIQFTNNGNTLNYIFAVEPWNLTLLQGTENVVNFSNGQLIGLQPDANGVIQEHTHILLHMIINGVLQNIAAGMGITSGTFANNPSRFIDSGIIGPIHTHDTSDIVHFEISTANYQFTLGDMFSEWGYSFNSSCLWGHCASGSKINVYINSAKPYTGSDPQSLVVPDNVPANTPTNVTIVWTS